VEKVNAHVASARQTFPKLASFEAATVSSVAPSSLGFDLGSSLADGEKGELKK